MALPNPLNMPRPYRIYGRTLSYFTRKLTGYMSYKGLPWQQRMKTYPGADLSDEWLYRCAVTNRWCHEENARRWPYLPRHCAMNRASGHLFQQ